MGPEDDGMVMSAEDMASEEYIGSMQNLCDAVERWLDAEAVTAPADEIRRAHREVIIVYNAYCDVREANARRAGKPEGDA